VCVCAPPRPAPRAARAGTWRPLLERRQLLGRRPRPRRSAADPAGPSRLQDLRTELLAFKLATLKRRALAAGLPRGEVEDVDESESPKEACISLLVEAVMADPALLEVAVKGSARRGAPHSPVSDAGSARSVASSRRSLEVAQRQLRSFNASHPVPRRGSVVSNRSRSSRGGGSVVTGPPPSVRAASRPDGRRRLAPDAPPPQTPAPKPQRVKAETFTAATQDSPRKTKRAQVTAVPPRIAPPPRTTAAHHRR
jgi:hypothetical protein